MRNEYPRPDFRRKEWLSLNGQWDFAFAGKDKQAIEVPFVFQSKLSGIHQPCDCDYITYSRSMQVPSQWKGRRIMLHFGAVDWRASVLINGSQVAVHEGGSTPFSVDITNWLTWRTEELCVEVYDPLADETLPRGKQFWLSKPEFIWYTPSSGIWQSVWLEPVSDTRWSKLHFTPNIDDGTVEISWRLSEQSALPCRCNFIIKLRDKVFFEGSVLTANLEGKLTVDIFGNKILNGPFHYGGLCWSPESPTLFDVEASLFANDVLCDRLDTYFGMRKVEIIGNKIYLNNFPYYQKLVLDQGYWKDGLLTAPDEQCFKDDILHSKAMGFNGCRKHEKAEDPVFLYWADKLGYLVWSAMPSFISYSDTSVIHFINEWHSVIQRDYNHPCIIAWEMLNESWGVPDVARNSQQQDFVRTLFHLAKSLDKTRLVVDNDGWEQTDSDICALHSYKHGAEDDVKQKEHFKNCLSSLDGLLSGAIMDHLPYAQGWDYKGKPILLSEFGGITMDTGSDSWGYTQATDETEFLATYNRMIEAIYASPHLCGFCYTQLTDVQQEKNGLLDEYHAPKVNPEKIRTIHEKFHY